jgi:biotin carboxylase
MSEHVLVVGTGRDIPARLRAAGPHVQTSVICQVEFVHKVRDAGQNLHVLSLRSDASDAEWVAVAAAVHAHHPFTRIGTFGERDQDRCAVIGEALGLPTHSVKTIALVQDKNAMREHLRASGLDDTPSAHVSDIAALGAFVRAHGLPCVVKPCAGAGSAGVMRVDDESQLAAAFARASAHHDGVPEAGVVVERYLEGVQLSVEALSEDGSHEVIGITRKYSDPQSCVEIGHVTPAPLTQDEAHGVREYVRRVLDAVGVTFGATHTELVLTSDGPRVIETHARMGGDSIPDITRDVTGVDTEDCIVRQTLGERVLPRVRAASAWPMQASAIWFAASSAAGILTDVTGLAEARAVPGVTEVEVLLRKGSDVTGLESSDSRVASVRALAPSAGEAVEAARQGVRWLELHVRAAPFDPVELL